MDKILQGLEDYLYRLKHDLGVESNASLESARKKVEDLKDTNNYICRDKSRLPNRDDNIYKDIENFKSYELTYCVAYEMAIRNKEIIKKIENYLNSGNDKVITSSDDEYIELEKFGFSHESLAYYSNAKKGLYKVLTALQKSSLITIYNQDALIIKDENITEQKDSINNITITTERTDQLIATEDKLYTLNPNHPMQEVPFENISKGYTPNLSYTLARPKLKFRESKIFNIDINLNIPIKENIGYLKQILSTYEKDKKTIKTYQDYFNDKILEDIELPNGQKKAKAEKYADWFFAYDYYIFSKNNANDTDESIYINIDIELQIYYHTKEDIYLPQTYRKTILPTMKLLIEKYEYKYLITTLK